MVAWLTNSLQEIITCVVGCSGGRDAVLMFTSIRCHHHTVCDPHLRPAELLLQWLGLAIIKRWMQQPMDIACLQSVTLSVC